MQRKGVNRRNVRRMPHIYGNLQRPRRNYKGVVRFLLFLGGVALSIAGAYAFFFSSFVTIKNVEVEGAALVDASQVSALVPKGSSLWHLPRAALIKKISEDYPVTRVAVLRGFPDSVRIVLQEKVPVALWISNGTVTLLNEGGEGFLQYPEGSVPPTGTSAGDIIASLPQIHDGRNLPVEKEQVLGGTQFLTFIRDTQSKLKEYLPNEQVDRIEVGDTLYDVTVYLKSGLVVAMNSTADAGVQIRNLTRLVTQGKVTAPATVDLRIDRWAYVH